MVKLEIEFDVLGRVIVGHRSIETLADEIERLRPFRIGVVVDERVSELWLDQVIGLLPEGEVLVFKVPEGETFKTLTTAEEIWSWMIKNGFTRKSLLIGLGGGVITDLTGFVASIYMRGIYLGLIPTTLMAQVDAAIGGKTGVDFEAKNILGTFYPPKFVIIDPQFLRTLPHEEVLNGMAEVVKYGVIRDEEILSELERRGGELIQLDPEGVLEVIARCVRIKAEIVSEDPYEEGRRRILNFGHTVGHAIERATNFTVKHGYAVSIGMIAACEIAERMLGFSEKRRVVDVLKLLNLPTSIDLSLSRVIEIMKMDKKAWYGKFVFVLPEKIGRVVVREVEDQIVEEALRGIFLDVRGR